jgi:hypothetical protein
LDHREALAELLGVGVLVAVLSPADSRALLLSSKLFEYLACGKPIVIINPSRPDRQFLRPMQGVRLLSMPSVVELEDAIRRAITLAAAPPVAQTQRCVATFPAGSKPDNWHLGWTN